MVPSGLSEARCICSVGDVDGVRESDMSQKDGWASGLLPSAYDSESQAAPILREEFSPMV